MFSRYFIERPVLSNVIALLTVLIGAVALLDLPVAQYPNVTPPTIQVTTRYPGASAETIAKTVAQPIEAQVNGVEGMIYMQSTSASDGSYSFNDLTPGNYRVREFTPDGLFDGGARAGGKAGRIGAMVAQPLEVEEPGAVLGQRRRFHRQLVAVVFRPGGGVLVEIR